MKQVLILITAIAILSSCKNDEKKEVQTQKKVYVKEIQKVKYVKAKRQTFYKELINNGQLTAKQQAVINFDQSGKIIKINVKNGQKVQKGDLLAKIEDVKQLQALQEAQRNLEKAKIELEDQLISQGNSLKDSINIPKKDYNIAAIRSGYYSACDRLEIQQRNLNETKIIAPFSGVISNLEAKEFNQTSTYKNFCTLIDVSLYEVEFAILETELSIVKEGLPISVTPSANENLQFAGKIESINPIVDDNGMLKVRASLPNKSNMLMEGMNVQILVKIGTPDQLIVPKESIVLHQQRKVIFINKNDTAHWHYVTVKDENSTYVNILDEKGSIKEGDQVIVEGNLELAHLSSIRARERKEKK